MQFLCLHLDKTRDWSGKSTHLTSQSSKEKRGAKLSQILFGFQIRPFLNLMAYDFLLNIAQIGNVSIFRGLWNMIDAVVWPGISISFGFDCILKHSFSLYKMAVRPPPHRPLGFISTQSFNF
jgi:hypothetical protein